MARPSAKLLIKDLFKFGLTKEELAVKIKVSVDTIRAWGKDIRRPSFLAFDKLMEIYTKLKAKKKKEENA